MKLKQIVSFLSVAAMLVAFMPHAYAVTTNLTNVKDTLSNSTPSVASNHSFAFTAPKGLTAGSSREIDISMPSFGMGSVVAGDFAVNLGAGSVTVVAGAPGAGQLGYTYSSPVVTLALASDVSVAPGANVTIAIGNLHATNPVVGTYQMSIYTRDGGADDPVELATLSVAVVNSVTVTATVQSSLTFQISSVATSELCHLNAGTVNPDVTTTSTQIPFGTLTAGVAKLACQKLTVSTNATNGYVVTVQEDRNLTAANGTDTIKKFTGSDSVPSAWATPPGSGTESYFGFHPSDTDYTQFNNQLFAGFTAEATPYGVATDSGPVSNQDNWANYKIQVTNLQEAGIYTNTLMYICTATF